MKHFKLLATTLIISILCLVSSVAVFASYKVDTTVDVNGVQIDTTLGTAGKYYAWNSGDYQGMRVSVYNWKTKEKVGKSFDIHKAKPGGVIYSSINSSGDLACKLDYMYGNRGRTNKFIPTNNKYLSKFLGLPKIFGDNAISIAGLKSYMSKNISNFASGVGLKSGDASNSANRNDKNCIVNKDYVVIFEPVVYIQYFGKNYALTHYEIGLFDTYYQTYNPQSKYRQDIINEQIKARNKINHTLQIIENVARFSGWDSAKTTAKNQLLKDKSAIEKSMSDIRTNPWKYNYWTPAQSFASLYKRIMPWSMFFEGNNSITQSLSDKIGRRGLYNISNGANIPIGPDLVKYFGLAMLHTGFDIENTQPQIIIPDKTYTYNTSSSATTTFEVLAKINNITSKDKLIININATDKSGKKYSFSTDYIAISESTSSKSYPKKISFTWQTPSTAQIVKFQASATMNGKPFPLTKSSGNNGIITCNIKETPIKIKIPSKTYKYTTKTEVITSFSIESPTDIIPDKQLDIKVIPSEDVKRDGEYCNQFIFRDVTIKGGEPQLLWFDWTTPNDPTKIKFRFEVYVKDKKLPNSNVDLGIIDCDIYELVENTPDDPSAYDYKNPRYSPPSKTEVETSDSSLKTWTSWSYKNGEFKKEEHSAYVTAKFTLNPDERCKTRKKTIYKGRNGVWEMGSGYGDIF